MWIRNSKWSKCACYVALAVRIKVSKLNLDSMHSTHSAESIVEGSQAPNNHRQLQYTLRSDRYRYRERERERERERRESGKRIKRREGRFQEGDSE